jgi:RNA polymerase sigma-70 factor, ECF subfamily
MNDLPITADFEEKREAQLNELYLAVYDELRRLANYYMRQERVSHTLQPTALVHEAYLRLSRQSEFHFENRTQFICIAAEMMRRILINHAVYRRRQKREGAMIRVTLDRALDVFDEREMDLLALNEALESLKALDSRQERIFELRFFGGLSVEETAEVLDISPATVKRDWSTAKLFLQRELGRSN